MSFFIPAPAKPRSPAETLAAALSYLPHAAQLAVVPVSHFAVGAVAIDDAGNFYCGANWEHATAAIGQTIHAEQSAIAHAWHYGARRLKALAINYPPCGHCRQFLNELRGAEDLRIYLPDTAPQTLAHYLPADFSPAHLGQDARLLDAQQHHLTIASPEPLLQRALAAAQQSYAPYSRAFAGVALQCDDGTIVTGRYAENAAYNPSLPPLQMALNGLRLAGKTPDEVVAAGLVCPAHGGHVAQTRALWAALSAVPLAVALWQED